MQNLVDKARSYLDARRGDRVTLQELASAVGASPFHLQRRFKKAFGVSPRDYQDAHRVESVKSSLRNGSRVTEALYAAGYGSVSRFYEKGAARLGMRARDYRAKGKGHTIRFCCFSTSLGMILLGATERGICSVKIGDGAAPLRRALAEEFGEAELLEDAGALRDVKEKILAFISGEASLARVPVDVRGTVFQRRVWDELRRIPRGKTLSYGDVARAVGAPAAVRAVGSACGANPVALIVPCHRVVRSDGGLGGYAWGISRKKRLLGIEKQRGK